MAYSLNINLNEAVKDFAPDLTEEEVNSIAESIFNEYDYSKIYDTIESYIVQFAEDNDLTYEVEELEDTTEYDSPEYKWTMTNYNNKTYKQEANPNATNSELDAKKVIINKDNNPKKVIKRPKDSSPYDKIPKRY